jgi:hypothetical protein
VVANIITNEVNAKDIIRSNDEEESKVPKTTYPKDTMTDSKEEHKTTELTTPRSQMGSNNVKNTPK